VFLWLSMVGAVFLVFEVVVALSWAIAVAIALGISFIVVWYVFPSFKR
jgi:hypothetical protein